MRHGSPHAGATALALALLLVQATPSARAARAPSASAPALGAAEALGAWRAEHGPSWRVALDAESGQAELLHGGRAALAGAEALAGREDDAAWIERARLAVRATRALHGVDERTLAAESVVFLPLAAAGTSDKWTVRLEQRAGELAVLDGDAPASVNALFDRQGRLLSLATRALAADALPALEPQLGAPEALALARRAFAAELGLEARSAGAPRLLVARLRGRGERVGRLAWEVALAWSAPDSEPLGRLVRIDALDGSVLESLSSVHAFDVSGSVVSLLTPGELPDGPANPEVELPLGFLRVRSAAGDVDAAADGSFTIPGASLPLQVSVGYEGAFNLVHDVAGPDFVLTQTLTAQGQVLRLNPAADAFVTAQANVAANVNRMREFVRSINPADAHADRRFPANVNIASSCNAFYDGSAIHFFRAQGGCANTAYSTVVSHEQGHWLNDLYGTGNGLNGMGEGNADVWAMFLHDTPVVGRNFCGNGCHVRTGTNNRPFCGEDFAGCYGEPHADGEPWMGVAWKIRDRLNTRWGDATGDLIADTLFLAWMNAYDQRTISPVIEAQWLALDDDDGNVNDGTPNYADVDAGFRAQAFPGFELQLVTITSVQPIADSEQERGPYAVDAQLVAHLTPPLSGALVRYRVNGGPFVELPLAHQNGDVWRGTLPAVSAPAFVEYLLSASDSGGFTASWPPEGLARFRVGQLQPLFVEGFEGASDAGWTHGSVGDTASSADDWQRGAPQGRGGQATGGSPEILQWNDPGAAGAGASAWGTDLGLGGSNGAYPRDAHMFLRSPPIDCSGRIGTVLRFRRWLSAERAFDQASVLVNGQVVWSSPTGAHLLETSWSTQELDVGALADGNPAVTLEWRLRTNGSYQLGGWNLDEVELLALGPASAGCAEPSAYGAAKQNSLGSYANLLAQGSPSLAAHDLALVVSSARPGQVGVLFRGAGPAATPFAGGTLLVAPPVVRERSFVISPLGDATLPLALEHVAAGSARFYQVYYRDPGHPDGTGAALSDALRVDFCP